MYTPQEESQIRQAFWTAFGIYMRPVPAASGQKVNWINYKTGIRHVYIKMITENDRVSIQILMNHPDSFDRLAMFDLWLLHKAFLVEKLGEEWVWEKELLNDNRQQSSISKSLAGVDVRRKADWPAIISFFKPRMVALDAFWVEMKGFFE